METVICSVDNSVDSEEGYAQAVDMLLAGEVVAFPTETVYGLGAMATDEMAVQKIFQAKGRPSDNPLIVHIGDQKQVELYAHNISPIATQLMDAFWPGPLTLVFEKRSNIIASNVTPGVETVAIRMPDHPVALKLLRLSKAPIAAPSANQSGKPSPTEAKHVYNDLKGRIPLILDGGQTGVGLESTVLDTTTTPPTILRPGGITREKIEQQIGQVAIAHEEAPIQTPRAPGMKYMHYAPEAPLFVIDPVQEMIEQAISTLHVEQKKVAIVGPDELHTTEADWYFAVGPIDDNEMVAANLYRALRQCDLTDADVILAVETDLTGVGEAVMNRLTKAANGKRYSAL